MSEPTVDPVAAALGRSGETEVGSLTDSNPSNRLHVCNCEPWAQSWTFEDPAHCRTCGGEFVPYSRARECMHPDECGGTCPKHREQP